MQIIILIELTVRFETNIEGTQNTKKDYYASLLGDLEDRINTAKLFTIEIGSKGYVDSHNVNKFKSILKLRDPKVKYLTQTVRNERLKTSKSQ